MTLLGYPISDTPYEGPESEIKFMLSGTVSGVPFAIDDIISVCNEDIPEVVQIERTSEHSAVYYFTGDYDRVSIAETIRERVAARWPEKYD